MSEILDSLPGSRTAGRPARNHPFDLWADGRVHKLIFGEDYNCKFMTMDRQLRRAGAVRDLEVRVRRLDDGLAVQFVTR